MARRVPDERPPDQVVGELMRTHGDRILRLCFVYLHDLHLAEDALQETFLKAWGGYHTFRGDADPLTWLSRIAINVCKDLHKSAWHRHVNLALSLDSLPEPRQMLCTDIQAQAKDADKDFMQAWNLLVGHRMRYAASYRVMARDVKNALVRYRAGEMAGLLEVRGRLREFDYDLSRKVLDHIEVTADGKLAVIFLTGTRVTV